MPAKKMKTWKYMNGGWWELQFTQPYSKNKGEFWVNSAGGWHDRHPEFDVDCEIVQSITKPKVSREQAAKEYLRETVRNGWLNPRGHFFGCEYSGHDSVMYNVIKMSVDEAETRGWIRVHADTAQFAKSFDDWDATPTRAQIKTLEIIGFHRASEVILRRNAKEIPEIEEIKSQIKLNYFK